MHTFATVDDPRRQRRVAHGLAGGDVGGDPAGDLLPAAGLPKLERTEGPAVAPADREVDLARAVRDVGEVVSAVVKQVAEHGPKKPCLRITAGAQLRQLICRVFDFEDGGDLGACCTVGGSVVQPGRVQHVDVLADLAEEARARLLPQRAPADQRLQRGGRNEMPVPGILRKGVRHGLDDVAHRVEPDHVRGAVRGALGPPDRRPCQRIDLVEAERESLRMVHRREHGEHADPVADEVRCVLGAHHALAEGGGQETLQGVEHPRVGRRDRDQLGQVHVARWVEEVHAAEARVDGVGQARGEFADRQTGGIAGEDRVRGQEGRDPGVQGMLPVHALGDRLDNQVAMAQPVEVLVVVGGHDLGAAPLGCQWGGGQPGQVGDRLVDAAVRVAVFRRQVVEQGLDGGVDEVGGDLCAHNAGAQHRHAADADRGIGHVGSVARWRRGASIRARAVRRRRSARIHAPPAAGVRRRSGLAGGGRLRSRTSRRSTRR